MTGGPYIAKARKLHDRLEWRGLHISIESRKGSWRHWYDPHADKHGKTYMHFAYGYLRQTTGDDGEHLDVYVGPEMDTAKNVYIVQQMKPPDFKKRDEETVMLGFSSLPAARKAFLRQYDDPRFLGPIKTVDVDIFVNAVKKADGGKVVCKAQPLQKALDLLHNPDLFGPWQDAKRGLLSGERLADLLGVAPGKAVDRVQLALEQMDDAVRAHPDYEQGLDFGALFDDKRQGDAMAKGMTDVQMPKTIHFSMESLIKAMRPPKGFTPIPNSKKGGYRLQSGTGYTYWYPDGKGTRTGLHPDDAHTVAPAAQGGAVHQPGPAGPGFVPTPERTAEYIKQHGPKAGDKLVQDHPDLNNMPHGKVRELYQAGQKIAGQAGGDGAGAQNADGTNKRTQPSEHYDMPDFSPSADGKGATAGDKMIPPAEFTAADFGKSTDDPNVTSVTILAAFPPEVHKLIADTEEKLRKITPTNEKFCVNGEWTPERQAIHLEIAKHFFSAVAVRRATPADGQQPTVVLLGGRGGSGKSALAGLVYDPQSSIVLDADEIKGMLPEYKGWNAAEVHEESGYLFDKFCDSARAQGLNVVLDATMKSQKSSVEHVHQFKGSGYRAEVHFMHMPRQDSAKGAVKRFVEGNAQNGKGRYVPIDIVLANTTNEQTFDACKSLADKWSFRDNRGFAKKLISEGP